MTIDSPILATLEAENARLLARVTELEGGMREQVALKEARVVIESLMDIKRGDEFETARAFLAKTGGA